MARDNWVGSFGALLYDARTSADLTLPELAKLLGVSRSAIIRWQANFVKPRMHTQVALIQAIANIDRAAAAPLAAHLGLPLPAPRAPAASHAPPPLPARSLEDVVRAAADDVEITAGRLRRALVPILAHLEQHAVPVAQAHAAIRAAVLARVKKKSA